MPHLAAALALTSLSPCALLAQVIPVSGGGVALRQAVAAAPNGAVLVVAPGIYYPFAVSQRALTIVAPQRATISADFLNAPPGPGYVDVSGLSASQPLRLIGFDVMPWSTLPPGPPHPHGGRIYCQDAHIENCTCSSLHVFGGFLMVDRTTVTGYDGYGIRADPPNYPAPATIVVTDSTISGGCPFAYPFVNFPYPAILAAGAVLRMERVFVYGGVCAFPTTTPPPAVSLIDYGSVPCDVTISNSWLASGPGGLSIACTPATNLALSGNQLAGGVSCTPAGGSLATLRWLLRLWIPGGTSTLRCHEVPSTLAIVVGSWSLAPNPTPLTTELLFAGFTPDWFLWTAGVTNALGDFDFGLTLPNVPAALYASVWLHGLTGTGFPFHATTPLGGLVY